MPVEFGGDSPQIGAVFLYCIYMPAIDRSLSLIAGDIIRTHVCVDPPLERCTAGSSVGDNIVETGVSGVGSSGGGGSCTCPDGQVYDVVDNDHSRTTWEELPNMYVEMCLLCIYMPVIDRSLSDCRYLVGSTSDNLVDHGNRAAAEASCVLLR